MRVLITGGSGFIGSTLAKSLLNDGHEVVLVDNFSTGRISNIEGLAVTIFDLDLSNPDNTKAMDSIISNVDIVYHFAASIGVKLIQQKPKETFKNSTKINDNLFPLFEKYNKKVIFSSTSEVYGETKNQYGSKETDHLEIHPVQKPRGSYACSKLFSEIMIRSYNFPSVIVRFFNIAGSTQLPDYGHVLPRFVECAVNDEPIPVYDNGQQVRSFCDVRDAVEMLKLLIADVHNNEIYNIGNSNNICTMTELAEAVVKITDSKSYLEFIPAKEALGNQFEEIYIRYPDTTKISQYYKCKYSLNDIIKNIYETNFNSYSTSR